MRVDYAAENNFGAVDLSRSVSNGIFSRLVHGRGPVTGGAERVRVATLDEIVGRAAVSLVKIDVESMELYVLMGARRMLSHAKPVVYLEQLAMDSFSHIYKLLAGYQYDLFWLETHPFNIDNFRGNAENIWYRTETGLLAVPRGMTAPAALTPARPDDRSIPSLLDARAGIAVAPAGSLSPG